jgi:DNA-binding Xre family transcriptional regulator
MIATNAKSVVEQVLSDTGTSKKELAEKMGYCDASVVRHVLGDNGADMHLSTLIRWCDALGYTVSVAPRSGASRYELHTEN